VLAVASGKGGAGKTSVAVNLAFALARRGKRVCLLDADLGLSNVDILLGLAPRVTLEHVLFEGAPLASALTPAGDGVDVIAGSSGVSRMAELSRPLRARLADQCASLSGHDYLVVDNSPGISRQVISLCLACSEIMVVVNPEAASITDAYALIKVLKENGLARPPLLLFNRTASEAQARAVYARMSQAAAKHLRLACRYLGHIPRDGAVAGAAARQLPVLTASPASKASRAFMELAALLESPENAVASKTQKAAEFFNRTVARLRPRPAKPGRRSPACPARSGTPPWPSFPRQRVCWTWCWKRRRSACTSGSRNWASVWPRPRRCSQETGRRRPTRNNPRPRSIPLRSCPGSSWPARRRAWPRCCAKRFRARICRRACGPRGVRSIRPVARP
jgi:flagellar biosynthesis protein FlhG